MTGRRNFLHRLAALAAGGAAVRGRVLHAQGVQPQNAQWNLTWIPKVTGAHRAVFDNPVVDDGVGLFRANRWKSEVIEAHGATASDISTVFVIRHSAIIMLMNDEFWAKHKLGEVNKINDPRTREPATRNPYFSNAEPASDAGATPSPRGGMGGVSLAQFMRDGGIILGCGIAFGRMVALERNLTEPRISQEDARQRTLPYVIPGAILQPSGFFATIEAQRAGCGFFPATSG